ncbi:MAG TPA: carbamate kinase [Gemmatimonadota bacterium]|nr:carbamate kinase [Gemmatimonadota bacterium]
MSRSVVVAIGGNALSPSGEPATVTNQFRHTRESLAPIVDFVLEGRNVAIVHGNGPQVGDELLRGEVARDAVAPLPLGVLVAATAGWIGYMIQQSLENALRRAGSERRVVTLVTQIEVDREDPAAREPRKFVGREVDAEDVERLREDGFAVERDDRGRLRRRVASPPPTSIVEAPLVAELVGRGDIVIAAGGGGIPVYQDPDLGLEGLDVVVDKDRAAALLASEIGADILLVLTDVDGVYRDFGTPDARRIERLTVEEAKALLASGELGVGSMAPKVEAAVAFVESGGQRAVIAELRHARRALAGREGTEIVPDRT